MSFQDYPSADLIPNVPPSNDEKTLALLAHVLTLVSGFLAPLIIYLLKKNDSDFISVHAKESLNFQVSMFLITILLFITVIGILLVWLVGIFSLVCVILATIKTNEGQYYRYPLNFRLIK